MKRRQFIQQSTLAATGLLLGADVFAADHGFPEVRVAENLRKFKSPAIEKAIATVKSKIGNKELAWLFENCFPNTLDTTVDFEMIDGRPDTFVITGDIDAMWLRDSSAQVWPYLPFMKDDPQLQQLIKGVINRQVKCILKDPYANAFYKDETKVSEWSADKTLMLSGVHERKWEIDSLCYPIRLAHGYWKATGDSSIFDASWLAAMQLVQQTFTAQQRLNDKGPYSFQRTTSWATDGVPLGGYGYPVKPNGMICSMFRPSDDATVFPYLIPSNFFAATSLNQLGEMLHEIINEKGNKEAAALNSKIKALSRQLDFALVPLNTTVSVPGFDTIYAYEVNGYGSQNLMDDANVPSLLAMPYLGLVKPTDITYRNTRKYILSQQNPFFFKGKAGEGIGGPHVGMDYIWPMSIIMRVLTSNDDKEIVLCLRMLQQSHGGTGFMHEAFHKDDAAKFTRKWFAWANTLFGELIWKLYTTKPHLLN